MSIQPLSFSIVDVFAERKYEGNQLAVFRHAAHLSTEEMLAITREMNFSETTFILSEEPVNGGYDVRIFTPKEEVSFAGHPTLGTAYIIQKDIIGHSVQQIVLNLKIGQIPVTFDEKNPGMAWMQQKPPIFGEIIDLDTIAAVLGIPASSMDSRYPIQEVSTGLPALIVPLKSLKDVQRCKINRDLYFHLIEQLSAKMILVFCPETYQAGNSLNARVFGDYFGAPEDPATGSANGDLAGYLIKYRYYGNESIDISVEQGFEIMRPSILYHRASQMDDLISIQIGGKTIYTAKGEWV